MLAQLPNTENFISHPPTHPQKHTLIAIISKQISVPLDSRGA